MNDLVWQQALMIAYLALLIKPFRRGSKVLMCAHRAFDRPEDRPYTLSWILSQTIVISVFIAYMFIWLLTKEDKLSLTFLPIIVSNIGDGLAEPIGIRYGTCVCVCVCDHAPRARNPRPSQTQSQAPLFRS